jgi:outer membrane protein TolC
MLRFRLAFWLLVLGLSACTVGPNYTPPQPLSSKTIQSGKFVRAGDAQAMAPVARWWVELRDPVLTDLIDKGLREAPGLIVAEARVRQARAGVAGARADSTP